MVNHEELTDLAEYWGEADDHLLREYQIAHRLTAPANFIVHTLADVNKQLKRGRPFLVDILRDGIALYEAPDHPFDQPEALARRRPRRGSGPLQSVVCECGSIPPKWRGKRGARLVQQRAWEFLRRAYIDARYSPHYKISAEELAWLAERIGVLRDLVKDVCEARLEELRRSA